MTNKSPAENVTLTIKQAFILFTEEYGEENYTFISKDVNIMIQ